MKLGLYTRYLRDEVTYAAIRVANFARDRGIPVDVVCPTNACSKLVEPYWDQHALMIHGGEFTEWAKKCSTLVWTFVPDVEQVAWCRRKEIHTVLLASWDEMQEPDFKAAQAFDTVVAPSKAAQEFLRSKKLTNVECVRWDPGVSYTRKPDAHVGERVRMFVPLFGTQPERVDDSVLPMFDEILMTTAGSVTLSYVPSHWNAYARKQLRRLHARHPGRVTLVDRFTPSRLNVYYGQHDLTVCPSLVENFCLPVSVSLAMGTPVVAFEMPPVVEFVTEANGLLVKEEIVPTRTGVPTVMPRYDGFGKAVVELASNPDRIRRLQRGTEHGCLQRREFFETKWGRLIL